MSSTEFAGKTIVVTGAGSGIGRRIAEAFAEAGGHVVATDISLDSVQQTVEGIKGSKASTGTAEARRLDVTSEASVQETMDAVVSDHGRIDVLVNNAGIPGVQTEPHLATVDDFERLWAVNVKGVWLCTKHVLRHMLPTGKGAIVNMGSIAGYVGSTDVPLYHSTKGAVRTMSKTDAIVYASRGIRVNCVNPGSIRTPLAIEVAATYPGGPQAHHRDVVALHPIGRQGEPDDVAQAVLYLASDKASFVTGADLFVDGGFTAQ